MSNPKIIRQEPVTLAEVKDDLERFKKRDNELGIRAERTAEYLSQFSQLKGNESKELAKKIEALDIPRFSSEHIVKVCDILPDNDEKVKILFQGSALSLTKENMKKIADTVKGYK